MTPRGQARQHPLYMDRTASSCAWRSAAYRMLLPDDAARSEYDLTVTTNRLAPGTPLVFQWRKWDGSPHWRHDCVYLGNDPWGDWIGQPIGWRSERPGASYEGDGPNVSLLPVTHAGQRSKVTVLSPDGHYSATAFRDHPRGTERYRGVHRSRMGRPAR